MTDLAATLAASPVRYWWAAPLFTAAAVVVALWTSQRGLSLQRYALEDARQLRIVDDVREVLAETLRDLHSLTRAFEESLEVVGLNEELERLFRRLGQPNLPPAAEKTANKIIDDMFGRIDARRRACVDAISGIELQAERIRLLLGDDHPLYAKELFSVLTGVPNISALEVWNLNVAGDAGAAEARSSASKQVAQAHRRVLSAIDNFSAAGRAYLQEQITSPRRPSWHRRLRRRTP